MFGFLVAHNFPHCWHSWVWAVLCPRCFSWTFLISWDLAYQPQVPLWIVNQPMNGYMKKPTVWFVNGTSSTKYGRRWAMKAEEMQQLKEQAKGLWQVMALRVSCDFYRCFSHMLAVSSCWMIVRCLRLMVLLIVLYPRETPKTNLGDFYRWFLIPRILSPHLSHCWVGYH